MQTGRGEGGEQSWETADLSLGSQTAEAENSELAAPVPEGDRNCPGSAG